MTFAQRQRGKGMEKKVRGRRPPLCVCLRVCVCARVYVYYLCKKYLWEIYLFQANTRIARSSSTYRNAKANCELCGSQTQWGE